jgi:sugar/nucleoside kinase (ribokinase family)
MAYREASDPVPGGRALRAPGAPLSLIVVGHIGLATDHTAIATTVAVGGSGYAVAAAASVLSDGPVGVVAQVGGDLDLTVLRDAGLDLDGIAVLPGVSARFHIQQFQDGTRSFESDLGVAAHPRTDLFPTAYLYAGHIHLGTAPPWQQLAWLKFLRDKGSTAKISVDMFEHFVEHEPTDSRAACDLADLIFMNKAEYDGLYQAHEYPKSPVVLKYGADGAELIRDGMKHRVPAEPVDEIDPIGAGEILAGVFLALQARGLSDERALRHAVDTATRSVTEFGVDGPQRTRALARIKTEVSRF